MKRLMIREYESIIAGEKTIRGYQNLLPPAFKMLEEFVLANRTRDTDALELMSVSAKRGVGTVITARNYVGLIGLKDRTTIEILPKIYSQDIDDEQGTKAKRLLIDMLRTLSNTPYKTLQVSNMDIAQMNILEIFIRMFINEVIRITKRGLKCGYETVEENAAFFKGKMLFSQQMKHNYMHKERCYVEYDIFHINRPENRLLKSTLLYLYKHTLSLRNKNDIKVLLNQFSEVEASSNYADDFAKYVPDRNMKDYETALSWSRVFLEGKSFTAFSGSEVAVALLFPMDVLFESYIAACLRKVLGGEEFHITFQEEKLYLFDKSERFALRPDIVVERTCDGATFILDTKWKILDPAQRNLGISQADMYQMYAYHKRYKAEKVILLYPQTAKMGELDMAEFEALDDVTVCVHFLDMFDIQKCLLKVKDLLLIRKTEEEFILQ